jgi:hypothetical protein
MIKLNEKIGLSLIVMLLVFSPCEADDSFDALLKKADQGHIAAMVNTGGMYKDGKIGSKHLAIGLRR